MAGKRRRFSAPCLPASSGDSGVFSSPPGSFDGNVGGSFQIAALGFGMNAIDVGEVSANEDSGVVRRSMTSDARGLFGDDPPIEHTLPERPVGRPWYEVGIWPFKTKVLMLKGQPQLEGTFTIDFLNTFNKSAHYNELPCGGARRDCARRLTIIGCPVDDYSMRTLLTRSLLGLEDAVHFIPSENWSPAILRRLGFNLYVPNGASGGWSIEGNQIPIPLFKNVEDVGMELQRRIFTTNKIDVWELYVAQNHAQSGRVTLPLLWDCGGRGLDGELNPPQIVTNESASICRVLNKQLRQHSAHNNPLNLRPAELAAEIDIWNNEVALLARQVGTSSLILLRGGKRTLSKTLMDFVERAQLGVYEQLNKLELRLSGAQRGGGEAQPRMYINGDGLTETDVRLYPLLVRYDVCLYTFYRLSARGRIRDHFPHIQAYIQRMYAIPEVRKVTRTQLEYAHYSGFLVRWHNRRCLGNLLNFGEIYLSNAVGALEPDAAAWRRYLAAAVTLPVCVIRAIVP